MTLMNTLWPLIFGAVLAGLALLGGTTVIFAIAIGVTGAVVNFCTMWIVARRRRETFDPDGYPRIKHLG